MKKLLVVSMVLMIAILSVFHASAQETAVFSKKTAINDNQIQLVKKGSFTVRSVNVSTLKKGINYLTLSSGDILYVDYQNKKITRFTLTTKAGVVKGNIDVTGGIAQFQCNGDFCMCRGNGDCNDMFTTNVCGPNAACFGEICICAR
jgi:hypothetical protein